MITEFSYYKLLLICNIFTLINIPAPILESENHEVIDDSHSFLIETQRKKLRDF